MNKKAFIGDIFSVILLLFGTAVIFILMYFLLSKINTPLQASGDIPTESKTIMSSGLAKYPTTFDSLFALFMIGLPLVSAFLAYMLDIDSIFFWLIILMIAVIIIFGAILSNIYDVIMTSDVDLNALRGSFPIINLVMTNYAIYALFVTVIILGGILFKRRTI